MPADPKVASERLGALHARFLKQAANDDGRDIVGVNNISELGFGVGGGAATNVVQQTWWRFEDAATLLPITTFDVALAPDPPP